VRNLNQGAAGYRMTFSFDPVCDIPDDPETPDVDESQTVYGNAFFTEGVTRIVPLAEEEEPATTEGDEANNPNEGAVAVIDFGNNLTYADVRIEAKTSGGGGGGPSH